MGDDDCPGCKGKSGGGLAAHRRAYHQPDPLSVADTWAAMMVTPALEHPVAYAIFVEALERVTRRENRA